MQTAGKSAEIRGVAANLLPPRPVPFSRYVVVISFVSLSIALIVGIITSVESTHHLGQVLVVGIAGLVVGLPVLYLAAIVLPVSSISALPIWKADAVYYSGYFLLGAGVAAVQALFWNALAVGESFPMGWWQTTSFAVASGLIWAGVGMMVNLIADTEITTADHLKSLEEKVSELNLSRRRIVAVEVGVRREVAEKLHGPIQMRLFVLWKRLQEAATGSDTIPAETRKMLSEICAELDSLLKNDLRQLCRELHPAVINLGLPAAIASICDHVGGAIEFYVSVSPEVQQIESPEGPQLPADIRIAVYRFVQEAVSNVIKHSQATRAGIEVWQSDRLIHVSVKDDGIGFRPNRTASGLGMATMRDYLASQNGTLEIASHPGQGAMLVANIPFAGSTASTGGTEETE